MPQFNLLTEQEQFVKDASQQPWLADVNLTQLTVAQIIQLRKEYGLKKFIPLIPLITFLKLNITLPDAEQLNAEDFDTYMQHFAFNDHMRSMLTHRFHPPVDESIEGDIYNQNAFRARSIVEEMSNSLDAHPSQIDCTIEDGFYEIRETDGQGMSPEILFTKYLLPKETTKTDSAKQIGRFGIGSFLKLAHLKDEHDKIVIETRKQGHKGCRIEFRRIKGEISVTMEEDNNIPLGTVTRVSSSDVKKHEFEQMLTEHLAEDLDVPVHINGQKIQPQHKENKTVIYIGGIAIAKIIHPAESFSQNVSWEFPRTTNISEARNRVILDNQEIRDKIVALIRKIDSMPHPQWVAYANSIAPLVKELQASNASLKAEDNVFETLINTVNQRLYDCQYVPDVEPYRQLAANQVLRLHPLITPNNWLKTVAQVAPEFSGKSKLYVAHLLNSQEKPYLVDPEKDCVFVDAEFYERLKAENNLAMLELLFQYPPGELSITLRNESEELVHDDQMIEEHLSSVHYKPQVLANPLHPLYQQHGVLQLYGDEATQNILDSHPQAMSILMKAQTLVATSPALEYSDGYSDHSVGDLLLQFRFQGKHFYYSFATNNRGLFDDKFQKLHHPQWDLLVAKIKHVYSANIYNRDEAVTRLPEVEIELTKSDVLCVRDSKTQKYNLVNGLGELIKEGYWEVEKINASLCLLKSRNNIQIYNSNTQSFDTIYAEECTLLSKSPCLLLCKKRDSGTKIYDVEKRQYTAQDTFIHKQNGLIILLNKSNYYSSYKNIQIIDPEHSGSQIIEKALGQIPIDSIQKIDCRVIDSMYYISILDKKGKVHLVVAHKDQDEIMYYSPQHTFAYPVRGITIQGVNNEAAQYVQLIPADLTTTDVLQTSQGYLRHRGAHPARRESDNVEITERNKDMPVLLETTDGLVLFDPEVQQFVSLNLAWPYDDIGSIYKKGAYYLIENSKLPKKNEGWSPVTYKTLVDTQGRMLYEGYDFSIYSSTCQGDFFAVDGILFDRNNKQLIRKKAKFISFYEEDDQVFFVIDYDNGDNELINGDGLVIKKEEWLSIAEQKPSYVYLFSSEGNKLITPYAHIPHGKVKPSNNAHSAVDDLVAMSKEKSNLLLTDRGYPFYKKFIPEYHDFLRHTVLKARPHEGFPKGAVLSALTEEQLNSPEVMRKLAWLNQQNLDFDHYSQCLRLIDLPLEHLSLMLPYINYFHYTPSAHLLPEYRSIIHFADGLSPRDQELIFKTFDLLCYVLHETDQSGIAQKLIDVINHYGLNELEQLHQSLSKQQTKLAACYGDFAQSKPYLDAMPNTAGQMAYYLLFPADQLLAENNPLPALEESQAQSVSLTDFMMAYQFDSTILHLLAQSPQEFLQKTQSFGAYGKKAHFQRLLQHAIYHQADPNQHLYERELLQNALDAYSAEPGQDSSSQILATLFREGNHSVFRLEDFGTGMNLQQVFQYFCLPGASTKRADNHQHFIGGHGVGLFTIYHNAHCVRLKTGKGDGTYTLFEFTPVYDAQQKIIDIQIKWQQKEGMFKGVAIERVEQGENPGLAAARHQRTFHGHGATVDANQAVISLNGQQINKPLTPLARIDMPPLGEIKVFSSIEDKMTVAGLAMKSIGTMDHFVPEEIRATVRQKGIIIDFPKAMPLNRERTDFTNAAEVYEFIKPFIMRAYIESYARLILSQQLHVNELPYDFFVYFDRFIYSSNLSNNQVEEDAKRLMNNEPLSDYTQYESAARLHALIAFLPLFKDAHSEKKYSLVELAQYYNKNDTLPSLKHVPQYLERFTSHYKTEMQNRKKQERLANENQVIPDREWRQGQYDLQSNWGLLAAITQKAVARLGYPEVNIGFSTQANGSLMYTYQSSRIIYWNVYEAAKELGKTILTSLESGNGNLTPHVLDKLLDVVSHELVHAQKERPNEQTHNRTFYEKQQQLLLGMTKPGVKQALLDEIRQLYQNHPDKSSDLSLDLFRNQTLRREVPPAYDPGFFSEAPAPRKERLPETEPDNLSLSL
ncbi:ATP-binding protein [Legionella shakespearei]|uniref:Histidine kinase-, DNA gyrase B-, and HSP90-like ATPase n=1 Tax=Legionella shakespearei DSM 23087 TaxID=1122169 RepID=A0A0W0ZEN6_9GAMM|nr:ATP-binding protein [Legionella shakespearei]KTD67529.1 Histidine kinase-, DNA gyrase B-, and HSP90-like ATPase [Legionella shakespearei DSM 23087]